MYLRTTSAELPLLQNTNARRAENDGRSRETLSRLCHLKHVCPPPSAGLLFTQLTQVPEMLVGVQADEHVALQRVCWVADDSIQRNDE